MGNSESSDSKKKSSKKGSNKQSDGLMGERRIRTFLIGGVLIAFCILALPYFMLSIKVAKLFIFPFYQ